MGSNPIIRSKILIERREMTRGRIIKLTLSVELTREDWGYKAVHPNLGLVATGKTESETLEKMDKLIARTLEFGVAHKNLKFAVAKAAVMGR